MRIPYNSYQPGATIWAAHGGVERKDRDARVLRKKLYQYKYLLLMLLPCILYVVLFNYMPMVGIVMAFKNYNFAKGILGSPWSGLNNFRFLFITDKLWVLTRNTLLYNMAFIVVEMVLQVALAILLNELRCRWFKKLFQSFMILPHFISWVVAVAVIQVLLNTNYGMVNQIAVSLGMNRVNAATNAAMWPGLLVILHAWKKVGYGSIVYMATVTGIDPALYEAASIDGANAWQRIRFITLPSLIPTAVIMLLLSVGQIFRGDFGMFYQLIGNNGVLLKTTDILDTYIYRALSGSSNLGMTAAAGLYQSVLCFVTIMLFNRLIKLIQPEYTLF